MVIAKDLPVTSPTTSGAKPEVIVPVVEALRPLTATQSSVPLSRAKIEKALRAYERCRTLLAEELGINLAAKTEELHVEILRSA